MTTSSNRLIAPLHERPFDVIVFGATGFTGKLVAEYLARHAERNDLKWAIAGRSRDKLEAVRHELAKIEPRIAELPFRVADARDVAALERLANETRVVCTTVGPYAKYGFDLARVCALHGTSYCDLTGEANFVRQVIDSSHDVARATKARIVHCAGYDSVPSDLGTFIAWEHAHRTCGEGLSWCKIFTGRMRGSTSGGTIATMLGIMEAAKESRETRRLLLDPHGLDPERGKAALDPFEDDLRTIRFDKDIERWTAPFVMASINTRVVRRSHALFREDGGGYGQRFRYNEAMSFRSGPRGLATATAVTAAIASFFAAAAVPPARAALERLVLPKPGEGPSREAMENGHFEMLIVAKTESGKRLRGRIAGGMDPGYGETAKMIAETAIGLAKDSERLEPRYGVLTPATALGMRLVERLREAGMTLAIESV